MRLGGISLYNYVGIFNGLGIYELHIDFTKCIHDIVVIKGDNGSGKSTLNKAISPINDPNTEYIPGKDGGKDISYIMDDGDIISISYRSPVDKDGNRTKTTCHVYRISFKTRTKIDLNPNGNVNEGKNILFNLFYLDSSFVILSQLSSGDRGLADKKPAERKKFINSIMDSLEVYNNIYKVLSKKSTTLKAMISSLTAKIDNLGNIEQIQNSIKTLENNLGEMEDRKVLLIANISASKQKIETINKNGNVVDVYNSLSRELSDINTILSISKDIIESQVTNKDLAKYEKDLYMSTTKKQSAKEKVDSLNIQGKEISDELQTKQIRLNSIGDIQLYEDTKQSIARLESELNNAIRIFKSIGFENYNLVSEDEYRFALNTIDRINYMIYSIGDKYNQSILKTAIKHKFGYQRKYTTDTLESLNTRLQDTEKLLSGQDVLKQSCKDFESIPQDCNHISDCLFITSIVKAKSNLLPDEDYIALIDLKEHLKESIESLKDKIEKEDILLDCIKDVKQLHQIISDSYSILIKFPNMKDLGEEYIDNLLLNGGYINLDTKIYLEHSNLIGLIKSTNSDLKRLKEQLSSLSANEEVIKMLITDIEKLQKSYQKLAYDKDQYIGEILYFSSQITTVEQSIENIKHILSEKERLQSKLQRKQEIELELPKLDKDYKEVQNLNEFIFNAMGELEYLNTKIIPEINNDISKHKYKLVLYEDYTKEYNEYTKQYDMVEKIKYYSSPTTGIQTIFMEIYMNNLISISNELLSMFFGGEFVLHPFVINENEFRIPCLGKGILNDDISSMSTSQICMISMILSFALLHKVSETFNIIRIDEIDGGLDTNNRLIFITVLRKLMKLLNYSQCVMISHNSELGMYEADIIVLKNSDPNLKLDGNIIYQYGS